MVEGASISPVILMAYSLMRRPRTSAEEIVKELSWVSETPDPSKCGCRDVRCGKDSGHVAGECGHAPTEKLWAFRWEYFCRDAASISGTGAESQVR